MEINNKVGLFLALGVLVIFIVLFFYIATNAPWLTGGFLNATFHPAT